VSREPIAAYVDDLARALPGPAKVRAELMAELADGLRDSADAYVDAGLPPRQAQARAVADSGPIGDILPAYRSELTAVQVRRTAMALAIKLPALTLLWDIPLLVGGSWVVPVPASVSFLADLITGTSVAVGCCGVLGIGLLGFGARFRVPARLRIPVDRVATAVGLSGLTALAVVLACVVGITILNPHGAVYSLLTSWIGMPVQAVTCVAVWALGRSIARTLQAARAGSGLPGPTVRGDCRVPDDVVTR
jgi:hypothetical protein